MTVTFVAVAGNNGAGTTGTAAVTTPAFTLPTGTASGDRVFIETVSVGQTSAPTNWTQVINVQIGGGSIGASTGPRYAALYYRDYDGVWTMPTVTAASTAGNTIVGAAITVRKGAGESFSAPSATSGSDTTSNTTMAVTSTSSMTLVSGGLMGLFVAAPATIGTITAGGITSQNATLTNPQNAPALINNTTGNDATIVGRVIDVTTGGTGTQGWNTTIQTARTLGIVFFHQGFTTSTIDRLRVGASAPLLRVGATAVAKVYAGSTQIWP